jgi:hypothetical protein
MRLVSNSAGCVFLFNVLVFGQNASLTGKMIARDVPAGPESVVPGVSIRLESEQYPSNSIESDAHGKWSLTNLLPGEYTLTARRPGFATLTIRGIKIVDGEQKVLPPLRLDISSSGCGGGPRVQYVRLIDSETHTGNFAGKIQRGDEPTTGDSQGIAGAEVKLICDSGAVCGTTTTNQDGEYRFTGLNLGEFDLQVKAKGFYRLHGAGYRVDAGRESIYYPIYLENCFRGDCNPSKRPKKPLAICE